MNGATLNGSALNASARSTFILALCAVLGAASVQASPSITRYCSSAVAGTADATASALQRFTAAAALSGTASVLAVEPYQTFASASVAVSSGHGAALADVTRYCQASLTGGADVLPFASANYLAVSPIDVSGSMTAINSVMRPGAASIAGSSMLVPTSYGIRPGRAAMEGSASVAANGVFVQKAGASVAGKATVMANGGYTKPSATVVLSGAQVFAYAKATRLARATALGAAQVVATGQIHAYGKANITGMAQMGAWVVQMQGASQASLGTADVQANATYVFEARAPMAGNVLLLVDPVVTRHVSAAVGGQASLRVETKVNNQIEAYSNPGALATLTLNAQGVVVAPLISHFDGSANIQAEATYLHVARASGSTTAEVTADALYVHQGLAVMAAAAQADAVAHWLWLGSADILGNGFDVEAYPTLRHKSGAFVDAGGSVAAVAIRTQRPTASGSANAEITADALAIRQGTALLLGEVSIVSSPAMVGSPTTRDPEERTMRRPYSGRTMARPFNDRTMKATRT